MPLVDLPLELLQTYTSPTPEPGDFDQFWENTLVEARSHALNPMRSPVENLLPLIDSFDVSFAGYGGDPIRGWLHLPAQRRSGQPLPAVVQYIGYSGGRGLVQQDTTWAQAGYAQFIMDTRGQGYGGISGDTPDPHPSAGEVAFPGVMTRGLSSREDYYYRRLYTDAFRAVEAVQSFPEVNQNNIVLAGISQGGALAIATAGLAATRLTGIRAVLADVPFMQDLPRSIDLAQDGPFPEIGGFLSRHRDRQTQAYEVLNYFDGVHFSRRAEAPSLYSVALRDTVCLPSTVFASYNAYGSSRTSTSDTAHEKSIEVYPFNGHEGGQEHHWVRQLQYLSGLLGE